MAFTPHISQCIDCPPGKESLIVVKAGRCKYHNHLYKLKNKRGKIENKMCSDMGMKTMGRQLKGEEKFRVFSSLKKKFPKPTGEKEFFLKEWNRRAHRSELSGEPINNFDVYNWHHILHKKQWGKFRLYAPNLILVTRAEHDKIHNGTLDEKYKKILREKAQTLKELYNKFLKTNSSYKPIY